MSSSLTDDVRAALRDGAAGRVILTAGNSLRGDDGVGPYLAEQLMRRGVESVVDAGEHPENVIDEIISMRPRIVVVLDAADFGQPSGTVRVIPPEMVPQTTISTHMIPLHVVTEMVRAETGAQIVFLGIQGESFALGEGLSAPVRCAGELILDSLSQAGSSSDA